MSLEQFCTNDFSCAICGKAVKRQNIEEYELQHYLEVLRIQSKNPPGRKDIRKVIWLHESCNKKLFHIGMSVHCVARKK